MGKIVNIKNIKKGKIGGRKECSNNKQLMIPISAQVAYLSAYLIFLD